MSQPSFPAQAQFQVEIQRGDGIGSVPDDEEFERWADVALRAVKKDAALCIRIADDNETTELNEKYRHGTGLTNVLSFPCEILDEAGVCLLGDIVICASVVRREAEEQHKMETAHWAHMVLHGILHLLGHDHQNSKDGQVMERMEVELLHQLGFADPYQPAELSK
ncbi:MAG: rRNA maturation RNase YbeY [Pseudomonadales bacterium]|jgi:probable rRNA maturation factor|nr:rRNA maturation RNase YbeY [Pseudomonadales bacterium]MDP7145708.1 rRNA maturation RNase YbeY [Pseudomonadales bacterium]MDP7357903.1 rRNA maturation RNase YbeY [Pseudomonadales bacterium]MDP7595003.1 rRNA maturation RNase YbeY [Pseudomonadales bacterium]HJN52729.1 rRNA maturation RNase YbeY [Pseudomonadales bacterium]|tara:strand:+ start:3120 stop:3614 length:495 start_codon:yes stop_codon:yes gene_type:complete